MYTLYYTGIITLYCLCLPYTMKFYTKHESDDNKKDLTRPQNYPETAYTVDVTEPSSKE